MKPPVLAVVGLTREARLIAGEGVVTVVGGGDSIGLLAKLHDAAASHSPRAVLSVGLAGALSPALRVGDWVVADRVVHGTEISPVDQRLAKVLMERLRPLTLSTPRRGPSPYPLPRGKSECNTTPRPSGERAGPAAEPWEGQGSHRRFHVFTGAIAASDVMVVDAAAKAALHASSGALTVDMESHVAAAFADAHGLPFAALRVISDAADRALPKAAQAGMKPDGGMNIAAVLRAVARDPGQLTALIRTGREAEVAFRQLALLGRHDLPGRAGIGQLDLGDLGLDVT